MVKLQQAIVVEGRYDAGRLRQIVDAPVFETSGFGVMNDKKLLSLLRRVAQQRGLIILTDSDGAGFVIRNHIKSAIPGKFLKHAYIPDIYGKEKRKAVPGKEGKLGVEGMTREIILEALRRSGATMEGEETQPVRQITKQDLMELGLSGTAEASARRLKLLKQLHLPEHMSPNAMLQALNLLYSLEELSSIMEELKDTL